MSWIAKTFHEPQGLAWHGAALTYGIGGYALGLWGLFSDSLWVNGGATLLLAHAMVICGYMIHECGHNTVFRDNALNARLGRFLNWICGSSYGTFEDIRYKHFRHHMDNDDRVWFVYQTFFQRHPRLLEFVRFLEWFYIPAHDLLMHGIMAISAFIIPGREDQRMRNALVLVVRAGVFLTVLWFEPMAALLYAVAYMLMMHVLRWKDSIQHDYGPVATLMQKKPELRYGGRETEQQHTFSNPESLRWDWPNWLTLCFGFHNAHHLRPTVPWYRLPRFHREQFGTDPEFVVPVWTQLRIYHRYRVQRVTHSGGELDGLAEPWGEDYLRRAREGRIYGGNAASFLTSF